MTLEFLAPAKINLSLGVGPAQTDGRHPLDSLVAFTSALGDRLIIEPAQELTLLVDGPFADTLSAGEENLVLRAASLLNQHLGTSQGAAIRLTKNLPIASGIGGGSADAAATFIGLNQMWNGRLDQTALQGLAAQLGADVPACVLGQSLRMTGTGEATSAVGALPPLGIVLVNPLLACPTGPVYRRFDEMGQARELCYDKLPQLVSQDQLLAYLASNLNDLEAAAIDLVPEIGIVLAAIGASPDVLLSRMSGSGATCFGLYPSLTQAKAAAVAIKNHLAIGRVWVEADQIGSLQE